jgi:N-acetylneuraminic acid mutarotase
MVNWRRPATMNGTWARGIGCGIALLMLLRSDRFPLSAAAPQTSVFEWEQLPSLPDPEGFAGPFAGIAGGRLIVAGGANFPEKRPWEGGTKVWYDHLFFLDRPDGQWQIGPRLPRTNAYGVSLTIPDGVLCIGGGNADRHFADVLLLKSNETGIGREDWPALPESRAFGCGAVLDGHVYLFGGIDRPDANCAQKTLWRLNISSSEKRWEVLSDCPGTGRILATAAAFDGALYICGGAGLHLGTDGKAVRDWLTDAWRYRPDSGWQQIADLPRACVAAPSPAISLNSTSFAILGGDDGNQIGTAPAAHRGFPRGILVYDVKDDRWSQTEDVPFSLVTTVSVDWNGQVIIPGGESRPGIRSNEIWSGRRMRSIPSARP